MRYSQRYRHLKPPAHGTNSRYECKARCRCAACRRAHAAYMRKWRRRNLERHRAYERRYYIEHHETKLAAIHRYRAKNLARINAQRRYLAAKKRAARKPLSL